MSGITVFACSPRASGVTDTLAAIFAAGAKSAGAQPELFHLREYAITPCAACGFCARWPHRCILDYRGDDTAKLFSAFKCSSLAVFCAPIHFYGLPAHFKAFIDRSQRFWAKNGGVLPEKPKPALAILTAGRHKGKLLFNGALRTLAWFLKIMGAKLEATCVFRGMENRQAITAAMEQDIRRLGEKWGKLARRA